MKKRISKSNVMAFCLVTLTIGCSGVAGRVGLGPEVHTLPANSLVEVRLQTDVVSSSAAVGHPVEGIVTSDVAENGNVLIPAGSRVGGTITEVKSAKRFGGQAMVAISFDVVTPPNGEDVPVEGGMAAYADKQTGKDAGAIIGGTVGGAILGKVLGKDGKDAAAGAVIGGGIGTAIASRKGDEAYLPAGTTAKVQTTIEVDLPEA